MQVLDMRALRLIYYAQKHLLNFSPRLSSNYSLCPKSPRPFHSTNYLHGNESPATIEGWTSSKNPKNPSVSAVYNPITDSLATQRETNGYNVEEQKKQQECVPSNGDDKTTQVSSIQDYYEDALSEDNRSYGRVTKPSSPSVSQNWRSFGGVSGSRKKGKIKTNWVCENCGYSDGQWWGSCRSCNSVGTMKQFSEGDYDGGGKTTSGFEVSEDVVRAWLPQQSGEVAPMRLTDVNRGINQMEWRIPLSGLFGNEVARVLGGGLVPGSLVLVGGDPGVGKSTLLLQIAAIIAEGHDVCQPAPVVYISGEESVEQIGNRADRMRIGTEELYLYSSTDVEDILEKAQPLSPRALIVDSIQSVYLRGVTGSAGGLSQVKECTSALLRFSKKTNIPVLLIGHVNKSGDIAGPRVLEHIVDVVLYLEGEKHSSHRLLRSVKNRFGSTDELGVFEMSQSGLQAVSNPSEIFLSEQHTDSDFLAGLAVAVIMDGSRSFVIEIQALCISGSSVLRHVNGIQASRADMIISVLMKQAGLKLQENGVFLNVVSGLTLTETAGDLAVAAAICSSFLEFPIPAGVAFIAEIGLAGELRTLPRMEKRVNTVAKLGYRMCIVPKSAEKSLSNLDLADMKILGCQNLKEVINSVFRSGYK